MLVIIIITLPEANSSTLKIVHPARKVGAMLVSGRVIIIPYDPNNQCELIT